MAESRAAHAMLARFRSSWLPEEAQRLQMSAARRAAPAYAQARQRAMRRARKADERDAVAMTRCAITLPRFADEV